MALAVYVDLVGSHCYLQSSKQDANNIHFGRIMVWLKNHSALNQASNKSKNIMIQRLNAMTLNKLPLTNFIQMGYSNTKRIISF